MYRRLRSPAGSSEHDSGPDRTLHRGNVAGRMTGLPKWFQSAPPAKRGLLLGLVLGFTFGLLGGTVTPASAHAAAPVNDDSAHATVVSGPQFTLAADLGGATREIFEPASAEIYGPYGQTVWWKWVAPDTGVWIWDAAHGSNAVTVTVLTRDAFDEWNVLTETYLRPVAAAGGLIGTPTIAPDLTGSFPAAAGDSYWLRLDGVSNSGGILFPMHDPLGPYPVSVTFTRLIEPTPLNDAMANRRHLGPESGGTNFSGLLAAATSEPDEPRAHPASVGRTLWWDWLAPCRGTARIVIDETNQAPLLVVYRRSAWERLEALASSSTEFGNECTRFWHARPSFEWDTTEGESYLIQADAFPEFDRSQPFHARLAFTPAPTNDLFETPIEVQGLDWQLIATNEGATRTAGEPALPGQPGGSSVWFRWLLPSPGLVQVTTNEPTRFAEPGVEVLPPGGGGSTGGVFTWSAGPCSGSFEDLHPRPPYSPVLGLFDRFGTVGNRPILQYRSHATNEVWTVVQGGELWIQMDGPEGVTGTNPLQGRLTPPPPNDARAARIVLPSQPVRVTGRTAGATLEVGETLPAAVGSAPRNSVWWEWSAPSAGLWVLRVRAGHLDNVFGLHRSPSAGALDSMVNWTANAPLAFVAAAGETFQIGVFSVAGTGGNVEFQITEAVMPPLTPPVWKYDGAGGYQWVIGGLKGWDLPVKAETSADLREWTPVAIDWFPGAEDFRVLLDPTAPAAFLRLRVDPTAGY